MRTISYFIFAILISLVGCASTQYTPVQQPKPNAQQPKPIVQHLYQLLVVDADGNPLEGVNIEYTLKDGKRVVKNGSYITTSDGIFIGSLNVTEELRDSYKTIYESKFDFKASKDGYYSKSGSMSSDFGQVYSTSQPIKKDKITLIRTVQHQYELSVVDVDGNPLEGVNIEYTLKDSERVVKNGSYITTFDGIFRENLNATTDTSYSYITIYKSEFNFKALKDGYYSKSGSMSSNYGQGYSTKKDTIILIRPIDYFNKDFASSISDIALKEKVLNFIDLIILQSLVTESVLEKKSINLISFKSNNYLQFRFKNVNVYNSLKLNKYDIGKILFDDVIRKVLSPLNEYIGNSDLFYGYDLTVIGYTKSFAEEHANAKPIEYRFLVPAKVVTQYKNKDISGQQVLDASVILMDDERIELKLQ